ncbi:Uncharacterized protein Rs2_35548 [Raphanus sativus]|nr:Uncharacterized protein Rs2_35548 [Raphanus sativus]
MNLRPHKTLATIHSNSCLQQILLSRLLYSYLVVSLLSLLANRVDDDAEAKGNRKLAIGAVELFGVGDYLERTAVPLKLFISGMDSSSSTASRREETGNKKDVVESLEAMNVKEAIEMKDIMGLKE